MNSGHLTRNHVNFSVFLIISSTTGLDFYCLANSQSHCTGPTDQLLFASNLCHMPKALGMCTVVLAHSAHYPHIVAFPAKQTLNFLYSGECFRINVCLFCIKLLCKWNYNRFYFLFFILGGCTGQF